MSKIKVVTIVGTRPEIIRLSRLIPKLDEYTDHIFVHTGQNSDPKLNEVFFEDLELRAPDYYLNVDASSMGSVMGDVIKKSEEVFLKEEPDAVMILGDTNSAIAAIVAERLHIPVYHMEAGNRSFDNNVPEELNRKMVDHVASFNLPYNDYSMRNLLAEGIHPRFIQKTGSPIREIYEHYKDKIAASTAVVDLGLSSNDYFLASIHRQENVDRPETLINIISNLNQLSEEWQIPVVMSTHPRTRSRLQSFIESSPSRLMFHEPFGYLDYNNLQLNARCVISDSGTISEESSVAGFTAVSVRRFFERPESLESNSISIISPNSKMLSEHVTRAILRNPSALHIPAGYEVSDFSDRVISFLLSTVETWKASHGVD